MNLQALQSLKKKIIIETDNGPIELLVKGLSLSDLTTLLALHASVMSELYMSLDRKDDLSAMFSIVRAVPSFLNDTLCLALGLDLVEESIQGVQLIPATDQMKILHLCGKQTFRSENELKEFATVAAEVVGAAVKGANHPQPSTIGSGNSAHKSPSSKKTTTAKRGATQ
jgi:hypothetical protein